MCGRNIGVESKYSEENDYVKSVEKTRVGGRYVIAGHEDDYLLSRPLV